MVHANRSTAAECSTRDNRRPSTDQPPYPSADTAPEQQRNNDRDAAHCCAHAMRKSPLRREVPCQQRSRTGTTPWFAPGIRHQRVQPRLWLCGCRDRRPGVARSHECRARATDTCRRPIRRPANFRSTSEPAGPPRPPVRGRQGVERFRPIRVARCHQAISSWFQSNCPSGAK